jgi:hypothetical protein
MSSRIDVEVRNALGQDLPMLLGCSPTETPVAMVRLLLRPQAQHQPVPQRPAHHGTSLPPQQYHQLLHHLQQSQKAKITATELAAD